MQALERNSWGAPTSTGILAEFVHHNLGSADGEEVCQVRQIAGKDFLLVFGRYQGPSPVPESLAFTNRAAVSAVYIPGKKLALDPDEGKLRLTAYVGADWAQDAQRFMHGSLLRGQDATAPVWFIHYRPTDEHPKPGVPCTPAAQGQRGIYLAHNDEAAYEHGAPGALSRFFVTRNVLEEFAQWLRDNVLSQLQVSNTD